MGQVLLQDNIPPVVKASQTSLTLAATHLGNPTRVTLGGQQYPLSAGLTLNTGTSGVNGIDTGSFTASTIYNVFAVLSSGVVGLVLTVSTAPTGFSAYKFLGKIISSSATEISHMMNIGEAFIEYTYNTNLTNADDTTTFGYGSDGSRFPNVATTTKKRTCRFLTTIKLTDSIFLEATTASTTQFRHIAYTQYRSVTQTRGMAFIDSIASATDLDVFFGGDGTDISLGYPVAPWSTWTNLANYRWRLTKISGTVTTP